MKKDEHELGEGRKMLLNSHKVLASMNPRVAAEMASLTKIMTCIVTIEIAKRFCLNMKI